jgi:hypothetical protein
MSTSPTPNHAGRPSEVSDTSSASPIGPRANDALPSAPDDSGLAVIVRTVAVLGLFTAVAVGYFAGRGAGASAAYGATLGVMNLLILGRMVRSFLGSNGTSKTWVVAALTKLAVLVLAMYLPVRAGLVQVLPFVIGFGALPLGIALGQLLIVPPKSKEN